ncbi:hypothetical protein PENANT_c001G08927 [Penicillium antarcticum]|uniref:Uncharacterized protein n=1 Tax=Penicillium antarcticum TaxID=416450 RepID=A0A1V6QNN0_9EURO|nr:uncharacterized protein N7508_010101 [Penicillium antarcticum]KAJ5295280.1 hypothetical protein N7508_010101 [Penicillium antarcticum]OQD90844.1 hypothetical protein PENANT_c001G08927 [Penicillium antarcticum]
MCPFSVDSGAGDEARAPDALEPIAIIGLANRFPQQASNTQDLWKLLLESRSTWSPIPKERFNADAFYHPDPEHGGTFHVQGGHYLSEDPAYFDGSFFNITKTELLTLDPQQRLIMENVYHALENAGIPLSSAVGSNTSVFVSGFNHDYLGILNSDPETSLKYKPTGVTNAILSNRVSWFFDFKGPSMTIDTACSSSLVALHLAVQSLRSRETNMAIVSGVSILKNPVETIGMSHHGLLGPQGRSFSFDSRAEGYVRGEGVGTVVVKPLYAALRDGDSIRAVIRETGANQDGRTSGITVPSADAQERLIREVYWRAGLDFEDTRLVEAHGTGTRTGDPIEAGALARAFKCRRDTPLYIGAIKTSIGHLEGGSGVAGIIKAILTLESGIITPNYDMKQVNPEISAADWGIAFPTENIPWPSQGLRRVSVNSFGIGGTNAHCILDDAYNYLNERHLAGAHCTTPVAPTKQNIKRQVLAFPNAGNDIEQSFYESTEESDNPGNGYVFVDTPSTEDFCSSPTYKSIGYTTMGEQQKILPLSAFDEGGVKRNASALANYLKRKMKQSGLHTQLLDDLSFTLSKKRSQFPWKSYVMASSAKELAWSLSECNYVKPIRVTQTPAIQFVFTGQGAQYQAMGRELMVYPVFRESLKEASDYIRRLGSPWSLLDELLTERSSLRVNLPEVAHPLCTALQVALVDLLASWGIFPTHVIGHSSGEIAAGYCAEKLSREAAWKVAYFRGYVSSKQLSANGAMMAVGLPVQQLEPYLESVLEDLNGELIIACRNSPKNNTVSGDEHLVDYLKNLLNDDAVFARKLNVKNAYHSSHMQAIAEDYLRLMGTLPHGKRLGAPHPVQMFSTVTGKEVKEHQLPGQYWVDNMVSPVLFTAGLTEMSSQSALCVGPSDFDALHFLVEVGPHSTLQSAIIETLAFNSPKLEYKYFPVLKRTDHNLNTILTTVGCLSANGYDLDFHAVNQASKSQAKRRSQLLVDLPPYSFRHTEKVLYESRLSKNLRTRKFPRHDLFGAPIADWNPTAPRWRHFVRLDENPWLRDHVVTGNYVYPGVGYLVMAIEASRQLAGDGTLSAKITGFRVRHVSIKRALIVPDTKEGIEVSLSMANVDDAPSTSRTWRRFHITSYNASSDKWTEHCTGRIMVEYESSTDLVDAGREAAEEANVWKADLAHANQVCSNPLNFKSIYSNLHKSGLTFGPLFQNLSEVRGGGLGSKSALGAVVGSVTVPDIVQHMPKQFMHPHLIHPATMDSMIHLMIAAVMDYTGKPTLDQIRLPTFIRDVWVSADLNSAPAHRFTGHASVSATKSHKYEGKIWILDADSSTERLHMDGIELTPLENGISQNLERKLCTTIEWKPDVYFLESATACGLTTIAPTGDTKALYWVKQLQLATMLYVTDALAELTHFDLMKLDVHMQKFVDWMKHYEQLLRSNRVIHLPYSEFQQVAQDLAMKEAIDKEIESHGAEGAITARMGRNIAKVIRQEVNPLHLMFGQDDVMEQVYKEGLHLYNLPRHLQSHLSLLHHQHSNLNILEIGGGTGSFTAEVLASLSPDPEKRKGSVASYTFTDISSGFFERAKQRFQPWADIMKFQILNIERYPIDQGLQLGTYDLIFAGNVIHATANLQTTLQNLRSLLRPGGKLIMQEGVRQDFLWYPLVFGQLPGWWLGDEPIRKFCPYMPAAEWDTLLRASGFSGVDIEYPSSDDPDLTWQSILISSAVTASQGKSLGDALIMTSGSHPKSIHEHLQSLLQMMGYNNVLIMGPSEIRHNVNVDCLCISLLDLDYDYLDNISELEYDTLKEILTKCQNILWVTTESQYRQHASMSLGLLRSLRWERDADGSNIITLTVANDNICPSTTLDQKICDILKRQFGDKPENDRHAEYLLRDGMVHIGRLVECDMADQFLASQSSRPGSQLQRFGHIDQPIRLQESETGEYVWVTDQLHETPLGDDEVEIYTQAVGLSSPGLSNSLSNEAAGFVTKIGRSVERLSPGDRVVCVSGDKYDCFRTNIRLDQRLVAKVPSNISFETAASLPVALLTAEYALMQSFIETDRLSTVLIHDGMTPVGRAAIQAAMYYGAEVYVCVATVEDRMLIASEYGIPKHRIFSGRASIFSKGIMRCTNGKGVMISLNTPPGEAFQETLKCISRFGKIFDFSGSMEDGSATIDLASIPRCASIQRVNIPLMARMEWDLAPLPSEELRKCLEIYSEDWKKEIHSVTVMDFSQMKEGIQAQISGKPRSIVFTLNPSTMIPVVLQPTTPYHFDPNASYVLAGGYGGLGRSLARWMVSRGARNLIFLSRSSASTPEKVEMITDLTTMGCKVHSLACDISDSQCLTSFSEGTFPNLPPIKGCIQASMVLRDGAFEGLSYEDWQVAIKPKVQGSWNLHETLPKGMDFFVMLSSVAGIFGNRGQSNYAAGNTFQDALAAHRVSQGLKASSLNLGSVSNVGWVAENRDTISTNTAPLFEVLSEEEVHAAVEFLIDPRNDSASTKNSLGRSQLILGLPTAEMCHQHGVAAPTYLNYSMFTHFRNTTQTKSVEVPEQQTVSIGALLRAASSTASVVAVISDGIVDRLASLLATPASEIDAQRFGFGGIDSLVAMEFRSWITKELRAEVSLLDIMGAENIRILSEKIAGRTRLVGTPA